MAGNVHNVRGSEWNRWDPHIHTPGTVLNDQFGKPGTDAQKNPWDEFLTRVETADPSVQALGVTDYYGIEGYKKALEYKNAGRLPGVAFLFPNVEVRLIVGTVSGQGVNLHLLFDPSPADHVEQIGRFLSKLTFPYNGEKYRCEPNDLIRLGRAFNPKLSDDGAALKEGVNQFKVEWGTFTTALKDSPWAQKHALIAVSGGKNDGTSGLQTPADSFAALRREIESCAHIIFSGSPKQRQFWLGEGVGSIQELREKWRGPKPCLHGSDAHEQDQVAKPALDRYCWIKGDLTFETLRQACLDPGERTFIGPVPPTGALEGQSIGEVAVTNAPWLSPSTVKLNSGLVAVIGARGSGKTALADLVAAGAYALSRQKNSKSFVERAQEHLADSNADLVWNSGEKTGNSLATIDAEDLLDDARVQYLSQQFVERLCAADGISAELIREIERVVFDSHDVTERYGTESFSELLEVLLEHSRRQRARASTGLAEASTSIAAERLLKEQLPALKKEREAKAKAIAGDRKDRASLVPKGDAQRAARLAEITNAVEAKRKVVEQHKRRLKSLQGLRNEVENFRNRKATPIWTELKRVHGDAALADKEWEAFRLQFSGDVDTTLTTRIAAAVAALAALQGATSPPAPAEDATTLLKPLIADNAKLDDLPLSVLLGEQLRLEKVVGIDQVNAKRIALLSGKISAAEVALAKLDKDIENAGGADDRIKILLEVREEAYAEIFKAVIAQEDQLRALYAPLKEKIEASGGSLGKLSLYVERKVDIAAWANRGEVLLDLRAGGAFRGHGELQRLAGEVLLPTWRDGDAAAAAKALVKFSNDYRDDLRKHKPEGEDSRAWRSKVSEWLFSTDHVSVSYGLKYDGIEVGRLSPGTRGIVLLMLYLALDIDDGRPLVIDQPEENLDPQSIFEELVPRFRAARKRRQIIMVTHNANLVVNTDADQVIVARAEHQGPDKLPKITYECGSLENPNIRRHVCAILEGGEEAFKERAKRLRVVL